MKQLIPFKLILAPYFVQCAIHQMLTSSFTCLVIAIVSVIGVFQLPRAENAIM